MLEATVHMRTFGLGIENMGETGRVKAKQKRKADNKWSRTRQGARSLLAKGKQTTRASQVHTPTHGTHRLLIATNNEP